jgi:hypothetical protein
LNRTGLPYFTVDHTLLRHRPVTRNNSPRNSREDFEFLARAITSHLETHGYTVVIGTNLREINLWVNTLSLFLLPHERPLCRHALQPEAGFVPELFVQGVFLPNGNKDQWKQVIPINGVLSGRYPITIVDLQQRIVRR